MSVSNLVFNLFKVPAHHFILTDETMEPPSSPTLSPPAGSASAPPASSSHVPEERRRRRVGETLNLVNTALGVAGLLLLVLKMLPALLPEVAVVTNLDIQHLNGLTTATTRFRNISGNQPITQLTAQWQLDNDRVVSAVEPGAVRVILRDSSGLWKILSSREPVPPQATFRTIFNSPQPFHVLDFDVFATTNVYGPTGDLEMQVAHMTESGYNRLYRKRISNFALAIIAYLGLFYILLRMTKSVFRL